MRRDFIESLLYGIHYTVSESQFIPAGKMILVGDKIFTRHMSEYYLWRAQATWHAEGGQCPTWDDATECRCMLGGEA